MQDLSKAILVRIDVYCDVSWSRCVVTSREVAIYQSVTLAPLIQTGQPRGRGDHCRLCQSMYTEVSANGLVLDLRKGCNQNADFLLQKAVLRYYLLYNKAW